MRPTIHQGIKAAEDIRSHITAQSDPVAWNTSTALGALLIAVEAQNRNVADLSKKVDRLEAQIRRMR